MNHNDFRYHLLFISSCLLCLLVGIFNIFSHWAFVRTLPLEPLIFMISSLFLAILANMLIFKKFIAGFLFSAFFTLIASRIAALVDFYFLSIPLMAAVIIMVIYYWSYAVYNLKYNLKNNIQLVDYQLIFLRIYVGFDLIPHFTEKLLAGNGPRLEDVQAFIHLGLSHAEYFVLLAGLCELGGAIALGLGLFTRLGALLTALYLLIATILGKHFTLGFIWASAGGGWEYPMMWIVLTLIFAISGANKFSLDALLTEKYAMPKFVRRLMGQ